MIEINGETKITIIKRNLVWSTRNKTISLISCRTTYDLENLVASYETRKYYKNLKTAWGHSSVSSFHFSYEIISTGTHKIRTKRYKKISVYSNFA